MGGLIRISVLFGFLLVLFSLNAEKLQIKINTESRFEDNINYEYSTGALSYVSRFKPSQVKGVSAMLRVPPAGHFGVSRHFGYALHMNDGETVYFEFVGPENLNGRGRCLRIILDLKKFAEPIYEDMNFGKNFFYRLNLSKSQIRKFANHVVKVRQLGLDETAFRGLSNNCTTNGIDFLEDALGIKIAQGRVVRPTTGIKKLEGAGFISSNVKMQVDSQIAEYLKKDVDKKTSDSSGPDNTLRPKKRGGFFSGGHG